MVKFVGATLAFALLITSYAGATPELDALGTSVMTKIPICMGKTGVTHDQLSALKNDEVPKDRNVNCFIACMGKLMKYMNDDNTFNKEQIMKHLELLGANMKEGDMPKYFEKIQGVVNKCLEAQPTIKDECEAAEKANACLIENGKKAGIYEMM